MFIFAAVHHKQYSLNLTAIVTFTALAYAGWLRLLTILGFSQTEVSKKLIGLCKGLITEIKQCLLCSHNIPGSVKKGSTPHSIGAPPDDHPKDQALPLNRLWQLHDALRWTKPRHPLLGRLPR